MIDKTIDEKEAIKFKKNYNDYLDKRSDIMKKTQFKVENLIGDVLGKDNFSKNLLLKPNNFSNKVM